MQLALVAQLLAQLAIASTSVTDTGTLPVTHGCGGADQSPAIELQNRPLDATHWAFVVDSPDTGKVFWAAFNIPIAERYLAPGVPKDKLTLRLKQARNGSKHIGWTGPCPAVGSSERVRFRAFALKQPLGLSPTATGGDVLQAVKGFVTIEEAELQATYSR